MRPDTVGWIRRHGVGLGKRRARRCTDPGLHPPHVWQAWWNPLEYAACHGGRVS